MTYGKCKDCKWWHDGEDRVVKEDGYGGCWRIEAGREAHHLAFLSSKENWMIELTTHAEFGCIQFQSNEDAKSKNNS